MKKIILILTIAATGFLSQLHAATKISTATDLEKLLTKNAGAALSSISITNAYLSVPPQKMGALMKAGYNQNLTNDQINILRSQEQRFGSLGKLGILGIINDQTYSKKLNTSKLSFSNSGTLYITINFTMNNIQYSFTCSEAYSPSGTPGRE